MTPGAAKSRKQEKYYHGACVDGWAAHNNWSKSDAHEDFLEHCAKRHQGLIVRTSDPRITRRGYSLYIDRVRVYALGKGFFIPEPEGSWDE